MDALSPIEIAFVAALFALAPVTVILGLDIQKLGRALSRADARLDLLLKHAGIEQYKNLPREIVDAVQRGDKIQAIKHYRAATGVGLREAKDAIEDFQRHVGANKS
jgi:hypothetical protein